MDTEGKNSHKDSACRSNSPPNLDDHLDSAIIIYEKEAIELMSAAGNQKGAGPAKAMPRDRDK